MGSFMEIKQIPITDVKPYTANPRVISDSAVDAVALSLEKFGWQQPIVIDANNFIVAGHTRYLAAKKLQHKIIPVKQSSDLSEDEIKAFRILDNKLGELTTWDDGLLQAEMQSISDGDLDSFKHLWENSAVTPIGKTLKLNDLTEKIQDDSIPTSGGCGR